MAVKVVINIDLSDEAVKRKALSKVISSTRGTLHSLAVRGANRLVLVGDDLDVMSLVAVLKKKVGPATIVQFEDNNEPREPISHPFVPPVPYHGIQPYDVPYPYQSGFAPDYPTSSCMIM